MNRGIVWMILLALSVGLNVGLLMRSQSKQDSDTVRSPRPGRMERLTEDLEMGNGQVSAMNAVHDEFLPQIRDRERQLRDLRSNFRQTLLRGGAQDKGAALAAFSGAQASLDSVVALMMEAEAEVLTPAQRLRWAQMEFASPPGPGPGGPPGGGPPTGPPPHRRPPR